MKHYYDLPNHIQWVISIALLLLGIAVMIPILGKAYALLILPFFAPFLNLVTTPFFRQIGYFKYLNPFVLSTVQTDKQFDLHNVFMFDYLVHFSWSDRGKYVQRTLLGHYFKALLTIIDRIEQGELSPDVVVFGHSYFFNERTANKLGFTVSKASSFWVINSVLQFIELSLLYSFSQGKLAIPKFWKVKRAEIKGYDLVKKKALLASLVEKVLPPS